MYSPNKQVGIVDPALATQQQVAQQIPQAVQPMTNVPPAPSNTLGQAQPVFPPSAQQAGQAMFGTQQPGSYDRVMPQAGVSAPLQQHHDKKEKVLVTGNTQDEQAKLNSAENSRQVKFAKEFNDYTAARKDKKNWENTENDFGFGDKEYPQQRQLDSLKTVYRNKQL